MKPFIKVLGKNYRQSSDKSFINILSRIRIGSPTEEDLLSLSGSVRKFDSESVLLSTTNERVDNINDSALKMLRTKERIFRAEMFCFIG